MLCVLMACLAWAGGCDAVQSVLDTTQRPTARITGASLTQLDLEGAQVLFDVKVDNPYGFSLPLVELDYALASSGAAFLTGEAPLTGVVPASGSRTIQLPARIDFAELMTAARTVRPGDVVPYRANMTLLANTPALGNISLPISRAGEVPIPVVPTVAVESVSVDKMSLTGIEADVKLKVSNPNAFGFELSRLDYKLSLGGKPLATSTHRGKTSVDAGGTGTIPLSLSLSTANLGSAVLAVLQAGSREYEIAGDVAVNTRFGDISMPYRHTGTTPVRAAR